ncbi:MAG TPA: phosphoenolpyruvate--protein phosphotransferase [Patescibacteria group bacterium]|nr:phosphoenolpyruvate--protein phosphotransferase [Patescibacteria group bacterium]
MRSRIPPPCSAAWPNESPAPAMIAIDFAFPLVNGLHARPACLMQEACLPFAAACRFCNLRNGQRADVRSILELVASDTAAQDACRLEISGADEKKAGRALRAFLRQDLPRADDNLPPPASATVQAAWLPPVFQHDAARVLPGRALAAGIGSARALVLQKTRMVPLGFASGKKDAKKELRLFQDACREMEAELRSQAAAAKNATAAAIMKAHLAMISDPGFRKRISGLISKKKTTAAEAIAKTTATFSRTLRSSPSAYLRERAGDLEDIADRLYEKLYGQSTPYSPRTAPGAHVVVAASLPPSALLSLDRRRLHGLVLGDVGLTSHTAILARAFDIPTVALPAPAIKEISEGEELTVDGQRGLVCREPGPALKRYYKAERSKLQRQGLQLARLKGQQAQSADGCRIEIAANIGGAKELAGAWRHGAEAIGLFRTETLFLERDTPPDEDEQFAAYRQAVISAKDRPVIIRTLDIGGDKPLPYLSLPQEENPNLGCRAVRFYSEQQDLIKCQLRAILRAARHGNLKAMVPMVSAVEEVRLLRRLLAEAGAELRERKIPHAENIEVGIMVETPAAAFFLDRLSPEATFFSIGSNDLLQYFMAVDRGNAKLKDLFDPLHPAFLRLLFQVAAEAKKAGRWLGLCGEMAGDPAFLPLLLGLGLDELSMASGQIPKVKARLRQLKSDECRQLLQRAMQCSSPGEVHEMLRDFNDQPVEAEVVAPELIRLDSTSRNAGEAIKELCDLMELGGRVHDSKALEEAVWRREQQFATDLGFGFALPHGKATTVKSCTIAFLRPRRPIRWSGKNSAPVRAVLLIAIPAAAKGQEHLKLIARLSRRLMHEDFREELLSLRDTDGVLAALRQCLRES